MRRKTFKKRLRGGAEWANYLEAGKAGIMQGLRNTPKAVGRALKNSLKSRNSAYSSYASVANMRGSNINNIMSKHNENFSKEAGNFLRPYTFAARNKVLAARNSLLGTQKLVYPTQAPFISPSRFSQNLTKRRNFTPFQQYMTPKSKYSSSNFNNLSSQSQLA